jgi:hypothetical protein
VLSHLDWAALANGPSRPRDAADEARNHARESLHGKSSALCSGLNVRTGRFPSLHRLFLSRPWSRPVSCHRVAVAQAHNRSGSYSYPAPSTCRRTHSRLQELITPINIKRAGPEMPGQTERVAVPLVLRPRSRPMPPIQQTRQKKQVGPTIRPKLTFAHFWAHFFLY